MNYINFFSTSKAMWASHVVNWVTDWVQAQRSEVKKWERGQEIDLQGLWPRHRPAARCHREILKRDLRSHKHTHFHTHTCSFSTQCITLTFPGLLGDIWRIHCCFLFISEEIWWAHISSALEHFLCWYPGGYHQKMDFSSKNVYPENTNFILKHLLRANGRITH